MYYCSIFQQLFKFIPRYRFDKKAEETSDRDMPIDFLPIRWDKLLLKLKAAEAAGITRAITFEFSHFLSLNSSCRSAGHLYNRYREYLEEHHLL